MKHKKNLENLVSYFLKTSPRTKTANINKILPSQFAIKIDKMPTDQDFMKNFIVHLQISYMYNYYGHPSVNDRIKFYQSKNPISSYNYFLNKNRKKALQLNDSQLQKKTILFQLIKSLNKEPQNTLKYAEVQQFMETMTNSQTLQLKRYLIHLYKWVLNQRKKYQQNDFCQELCQDLSETLIKKIYNAHQNLSSQSIKSTQEQLTAIQTLQEARQKKKSGDLETAKVKYQKVYNAETMTQKDKIEALQYLCERGTQQNDQKYLLGIVQKIRQKGGLETHEKIVLKAIQKISHRTGQSKKSLIQANEK